MSICKKNFFVFITFFFLIIPTIFNYAEDEKKYVLIEKKSWSEREIKKFNSKDEAKEYIKKLEEESSGAFSSPFDADGAPIPVPSYTEFGHYIKEISNSEEDKSNDERDNNRDNSRDRENNGYNHYKNDSSCYKQKGPSENRKKIIKHFEEEENYLNRETEKIYSAFREYKNRNNMGNGCGSENSLIFKPWLVPDVPFGNDCNNHDKCIGTIGKSKNDCDKQFCKDILHTCEKLGGQGKFAKARQNACYTQAIVYCIGAKLGGKNAYNKAQEKAKKKKKEKSLYKLWDSRRH